MFESATFDSMGTIHTRSRNWMFATFGFNAAILAALIAIPLFHPAMLTPMMNKWLIETPAPQVEETKPVVQPQHQTTLASEIFEHSLVMPRQIPTGAWIPDSGGDVGPGTAVSFDPSAMGTGSPDNPFGGHQVRPYVRQSERPTPNVSKGVMEGLLIYRVLPVYPAMARAIHAAGTVHLQASISCDGAIENLRVLDGPPLLQQAAIDAVKQWRYKPYLLNGQPVEVETTINVEFQLD
jgi:protein TonB